MMKLNLGWKLKKLKKMKKVSKSGRLGAKLVSVNSVDTCCGSIRHSGCVAVVKHDSFAFRVHSLHVASFNLHRPLFRVERPEDERSRHADSFLVVEPSLLGRVTRSETAVAPVYHSVFNRER